MTDKTTMQDSIQPLDNAPSAKHESRRDFLKKYGKLAAITPVAMTMTLHEAKALASCGTDCGFDGDFGGGI